MTIWSRHPARPVSLAAPTPLLTHLAAQHAAGIARLWAPPHGEFINAAADRRHLICIASQALGADLTPSLADDLLSWPLRRAIKAAAPGAPIGLARALARLGEVAWPAEDYAGLLELLALSQTARVLRHAKSITLDQVRAMAGLIEPLRRAGLGGAGLGGDQVQLLNEVYEAMARRDGAAAADEAARRWAAGGSLADVFARARACLRRQPRPDPLPPSPRLRYLATLDAITDAGGRYNNCLKTLDYAGDADVLFYEWLGEPGATLELMDDRLFGWRLNEARRAGNVEISREQRREITATLRALGVHVGRSVGQLTTMLWRARRGDFLLRSRLAAEDDAYRDGDD